MKRNFRLTQSTDFKRVRNFGKSYAHPLLVLVALPATEESLREALRSSPGSSEVVPVPARGTGHSRVGVTAGRSVGGAIQRNRAKRLLREAMRVVFPALRPGWDLILIARQPLPGATYQQVEAALSQLLRRAGLLVS